MATCIWCKVNQSAWDEFCSDDCENLHEAEAKILSKALISVVDPDALVKLKKLMESETGAKILAEVFDNLKRALTVIPHPGG